MLGVQKTMPEPAPLIRDVRSDEIQRLHNIDQICFPAHVAYSRVELLFFLNHGSSISKVAERDGHVLGFAIGQIKAHGHAHVITIDVIPEARRGRVGRALMETLHAEFRARGAGQASLEVDAHNNAAQRFYMGRGYRRADFLRGYYKGRGDAYRMVLDL
jgi:ribosomal-protein-alanine N-acetyltransferase